MAQVPATRRSQGGQVAPRSEHPLERFHRDFDTLFGRLLGGWLTPFEQDVEPPRLWAFDVTENDQELVVRAELPGFEEKELDVQIDSDVLTIKAEKEQKSDQQREYRSFFRRMTLPPGVDAEKAQAVYRNGVLELHLPRKAGTQAKHLTIQREQPEAGQPEGAKRSGNGASGTEGQAKGEAAAGSKKSGK